MEQSNLAMRIRIKKLGVLIKDARLTLEKEPDECAEALDIAVERYLDYEDGEKVTFDVDPYTGFWRRFGVGFMRIMPIESQL